MTRKIHTCLFAHVCVATNRNLQHDIKTHNAISAHHIIIISCRSSIAILITIITIIVICIIDVVGAVGAVIIMP